VEEAVTGRLFEAGNANDLAARATEMANRSDELQLMGKRGRQLVETKYSPEQNYRRLMDIFSSIAPARMPESLPLAVG
jgi:glycosyltransferase involved in cell wall biosynthesis